MDEEGNITDTVEDRCLYVEDRHTECDYFYNLLNNLHEENEQLKNDYITLKLQDNDRYEYCNELKKENEELKKELQRMYDVATLNKAINVLEERYDKMLSDGSSEIKDAMRMIVLKCIEDLDGLKDDITAR